MTRRRFGYLAVRLAGLGALTAVPWIVDSAYLTHVINLACVNAIATMGLTFIMGFCGQLSLGHAGLFAVGAYTSSLLAVDAGFPFWIALPAAVVAATCVGGLLGVPTLKLKTHYLAMATLGFNEILRLVLTNWKAFSHGADGIVNIPPPSIGPIKFAGVRSSYYLVMVLTLIVYFVSRRIENSRIGRSFKAVRESEIAAEVTGVDTHKMKILAFALSAAWGGLAGSLHAHLNGFIAPNDFGIQQSTVFLSMAIAGGSSSLLGAVLGAVVFTLLPEYLRFLQRYSRLIYGLLLAVIMIGAPSGLVGILRGASSFARDKLDVLRGRGSGDEAPLTG
jgi:branched-chain amino acid transport system permease protein